MAEIISKNQQLVTGALSPVSAYSRMLLLSFLAATPPGGNVHAVTTAVGGTVVLLGIDVWIFGLTLTSLCQVGLVLTTGRAGGDNVATVMNDWETIVHCGPISDRGFTWYGNNVALHFNMKKRYTGSSRRFGCVASILPPSADFLMLVGFEISEG